MRTLFGVLLALSLLGGLSDLAAPAETLLTEVRAAVLRAIDEKDEKLRAEQLKAEQAYEKSCTGLDQLERAFEEKNDNSPRATEAFNKLERKLSGSRDAAQARLRSLEGDMLRAKALVDSAVLAANKILVSLSPQALPIGLDVLEAGWLRSPQEAEALKHFDALARLPGEEVRRRVGVAMASPTLTLRVRAAAIDCLASVEDGTLPSALLPYLQLTRAEFDLMSAAIRAIERVHRRYGIEPLIAFLGRENQVIGRLREDATTALRSLTGEAHGPYREP